MATTISGDIYEGVRLDIGDPDGQIFNDTFMAKLFKKAVRRLNQVLGLSATSRPIGIPGYKSLSSRVSRITYDLTGDTINPDNDEIADLIILQMEYIIKKGEVSALKRLSAAYGGVFATSAGGAQNDDVSVTNADGVTVKVGSNRLSNRARLFQLDLETIKEELEDAIQKFIYRQTGNYGKLIF